jgi:hypothetical protein
MYQLLKPLAFDLEHFTTMSAVGHYTPKLDTNFSRIVANHFIKILHYLQEMKSQSVHYDFLNYSQNSETGMEHGCEMPSQP